MLSTAYALARAHGEEGWTERLVPLTVDGLSYTSSMVMLDSTPRNQWESRGLGLRELGTRPDWATNLWSALARGIQSTHLYRPGINADAAKIRRPRCMLAHAADRRRTLAVLAVTPVTFTTRSRAAAASVRTA
jgi:hypothetical protein